MPSTLDLHPLNWPQQGQWDNPTDRFLHILILREGTHTPEVHKHLQEGGLAVSAEEMTRNDPDPRTERWVVVHEGEATIPVVSWKELCIQHGEETLFHVDGVLQEVAQLLALGVGPWELRPVLLSRYDCPAPTVNSDVQQSH